MNDQQTEALIHQEGATAGPRTTPQDMADSIAHVEYVVHESPSGQILRWCVFTMKNGYSHSGRPAVAASRVNDRAVIGEKIAYDNAVHDLKPLMGYAMKERLAHTQPAVATHEGKSLNLQPHQTRVVDEHRELTVRLNKLSAFIQTDAFTALPEAERARLRCQAVLMTGYAEVLDQRIRAFIEQT